MWTTGKTFFSKTPAAVVSLAVTGAFLCWAGCAAPYTVRTVGKGHTALHASFGGPLVSNLGPPLPLPAGVVGAQYGILDVLDLSGSFHVLPAFYKTVGIDLGVTGRIVKQRGGIPELTATLRLSQMFDTGAYRIFPELEAYASWLLGRRWLLYVGMHTLYDFFWHRDHHVRVHWGPVVGCDLRFAKRYALGLAVRWVSPNLDTYPQTVDYVAPWNRGMIFVQLGFHINIQGWRVQP